ncbi:MAG: cell division protein FtsQ/DivIB [Acidobacteriota bacterium]
MSRPEEVVRALLRAGGVSRPAVTRLQKERKRRSLRRALLFVLVVAGLSGLTAAGGRGWILLQEDSAFAIRDIQLVGLNRHPPAEVLSALRDLRGRNLVVLPPEEVARRLSAFPWLKGFLCRKHLPGTLLVEVEERETLCAVRTPEGTFEIDGRGFAWKALPGTGAHFALGAGLDPADPSVQGVLVDLLRLGLHGQVLSLEAERPGSAIALRCADGWTLVASPADLPSQWERFQKARAWAEKYAPDRRTADLRWSGKIVLRPPEPKPADTAPATAGEGGTDHG